MIKTIFFREYIENIFKCLNNFLSFDQFNKLNKYFYFPDEKILQNIFVLDGRVSWIAKFKFNL